ncbi:hypothetical protein V3H18_04855 [Methylocystis sp. 9N]|uniref:Uncharacterized protein n=1 Tax=Methylocystis borbori TaxID=3118750 RepID=A0ABU7XFC8_9HYPH
MTDSNDGLPRVDPRWAADRKTHIAIATAIHAIADGERSAEAIWDAPTDAEIEQVMMAVQDYIERGDFDAKADGHYQWGAGVIVL